MQAHLITIGDEILIGQIVDTNSAWMAQQLNLHGIQVAEIVSVSDRPQHIVEALERSLKQVPVILMTGGLGPTKDDLTKNTLARYFGMELAFHEPSWHNLQALFSKFGRTADDRYRQQCAMPEGAVILTNAVGTAPGMWFEHQGKIVVSMPGVPWEMQYLMEHEVLPRLEQTFPRSPIAHHTILTAGVGETDLAERIATFEESLPSHIKLAYLPYLGGVRLRLTGRGAPKEQLLTELHELTQTQLLPLIGSYVYGYGTATMESALGQVLTAQNAMVATAESCTGGYIAHRITSVPGSSAYFTGGTVTYTNAQKIKVLGVLPADIDTHGAVSEPVVRQMVAGVLRHTGADYAIATSGIMGPDGGTPDKPVGTVWIAVGHRDGRTIARKLKVGRDRQKNIELTTHIALNLLRRFATGQLSDTSD